MIEIEPEIGIHRNGRYRTKPIYVNKPTYDVDCCDQDDTIAKCEAAAGLGVANHFVFLNRTRSKILATA